MPKKTKTVPVRPSWTKKRGSPWKVEVPGRYSESGKRERYFFGTKAEADNYSEELRIRLENFGSSGSSILGPAHQEQAKAAFTALTPYGVSLNEVVQDWITRKVARDTTVTLVEGYQQYENQLKTRKIRGRPVSESYKRQVRCTLPRFSSLHNQPLTEIDGKMIAQAVQGVAPYAKNGLLRTMSAFFNWAAEVPRQWVKDNPVKMVPMESVGGGEVKLFSVKEARAILTKSIRLDNDLLPYFVFGFFAGIRPEELERMEWEFVNLSEKSIVLPAEVTKTNQRRVIEINDTLSSWLEWIIARKGIQRGSIFNPVNLRKRLRYIRSEAKVRVIQDGMRHCYASNWLALHKDVHRLRANMGHQSEAVLWNHYHKATTEKEAATYWAISPKSENKSKIVKFSQGNM